MTELLEKISEKNIPEIQYTYKKKNDWMKREYESGLKLDCKTYNRDMKRTIVFLQNDAVGHQKIEQYMKKIAKKFDRIQVDERKLSGMPVVKNTRIPVSLIVACLKDEMSIREICEEYRLTWADVEEAMEYVIEILDAPYQEGRE